MLEEIIAKAINSYSGLSQKLTDILVDSQLNVYKGNPQRDIQGLIKDKVLTEFQNTISKINSEKELKYLYDAYVDCLIYDTPPQLAAPCHGVSLDDLMFLLTYKRLQPEELSVSKTLKRLREKK